MDSALNNILGKPKGLQALINQKFSFVTTISSTVCGYFVQSILETPGESFGIFYRIVAFPDRLQVIVIVWQKPF